MALRLADLALDERLVAEVTGAGAHPPGRHLAAAEALGDVGAPHLHDLLVQLPEVPGNALETRARSTPER